MYENKDYDSILEDMLANVSDDFDQREGSVIYDALAPAAMRMAEFYTALDIAYNEIFADTASYYYLIKRAAERGLRPHEETCAVCKMIVTPPRASISIGDRFNLNNLNYAVTAVIDSFSGSYQLTCESAGTAANQQIGSLLPIETANELNDLESAEITEILIPGEDEEDVEIFRHRYFSSFNNKAFGGNKSDYREAVNDIDGVGGCKAARRWNEGYRPAEMLPTKAVTEWFEQQTPESLGIDVYAWLNRVYSAAANKLLTVGGTVEVVIINSEFKPPSETLVKTVQEKLDPEQCAGEGDGIAPIGHVVKVSGVTTSAIDVALEGVEYKTGFSFDNMKPYIESVIDDYFTELCQSWADDNGLVVRTSRIETRIIGLKGGIIDIKGISLNGLPENIVLGEYEIPVRGDVSG